MNIRSMCKSLQPSSLAIATFKVALKIKSTGARNSKAGGNDCTMLHMTIVIMKEGQTSTDFNYMCSLCDLLCCTG